MIRVARPSRGVTPMWALAIAVGACFGCTDETSKDTLLEPTACRFALQPHHIEGDGVACYDLRLRDDGDGARAISEQTLHLARFVSDTAPKGSPTINLAGGPGPAQYELSALTPERLTALLRMGDFVVFDYRQVGTSRPLIPCTGADIAACIEALPDQGASLAHLDSAHLADDVNAIRLALGAETVNLVGVSYGTRVGLELMRRHPRTVRAAVLDSCAPPQVIFGIEVPRNFEAAMAKLFAGCAADAACNDTYPELETLFYAALSALLDEPVVLDGGDRLDAPLALNALFNAMYHRSLYDAIPAAIAAVASRDRAAIQRMMPELRQFSTTITQAVQLMGRTVQCNDSAQHASNEAVDQALSGLPAGLVDVARAVVEAVRAGCDALPLKAPDAVDIQPVTSAVPTLILAGELDPVTPPRYGRLAAETLTQATVVEAPWVGHGVQLTECGFSLAVAFLENPASPLDTSCLRSLTTPRFRTEGI